MKILFLSPMSTFSGRPHGGAEKSMADLAKNLISLGHDVHFITGQDFLRLSKSKRTEVDGVKVHFLPVFNLPGLRINFIKRLNYYVRSIIVKNYLNKHFTTFQIAYAYNELPAIYDLVNWRNRHKTNIKIVYRSAGLYWFDQTPRGDKSRKKKLSKIFNEVDLINYNCNGMKQLFHQALKAGSYDISIKKEVILDIGTNIDIKGQSWEAQKSEEVFRLVMPSRFDGLYKKQEVLIKAFKKLGLKNSELIFLGDGPEMLKMGKICEQDSFLKERVIFKGFVSSEEVVQSLLESSFMCLCTSLEGMSKSIAEAMKLGVPIIASNVLSINSYITDSMNGLLSENTEEAWCQTLRLAYEMPIEDRLKLSRESKNYFDKNLDPSVNSKVYEKVFEDLIA